MAYPQTVIMTALMEATAQTSWRYNKDRVKEFIRLSRGWSKVPDDPKDKSMSWCADFVYWVLARSNIQPMPEAWGLRAGGSNAISRYTNLYTRVDQPEPGDIYYMPVNPAGFQKDHVGIVFATDAWPATFTSIDGNTDGGLGGNPALVVKGYGGGYVAKNQRSPGAVSKPITYYRPPYS